MHGVKDMSDTCVVNLCCLRADMEYFEAEGFIVDDIAEGMHLPMKSVSLYDDTSNYGAQDELTDLALRKHLPFYGSHGAGDNYPEACFAAADGQIAWPTSMGGEPVARINEFGIPDESDMREAKLYYELLKRARGLLGVIGPSS
jgi:hypothetical protein